MTEIHIVNEDIFRIKADLMVNPVNCVGVMGAGLARKFVDRFPSILQKYKWDCLSGVLDIGKPTIYNRHIICFPTKYHWRDPSKLIYINSGLLRLREFVKFGQSIAIPALGCGLGGLFEKDVIPMIVRYMMDSDFKTVYISLFKG